MATATADQTGYIDASVLYTLPEIQRRLGLGKHALRTARRRGLVVRRIGRKGFLLGRDVIKYIEAASTVDES